MQFFSGKVQYVEKYYSVSKHQQILIISWSFESLEPNNFVSFGLHTYTQCVHSNAAQLDGKYTHSVHMDLAQLLDSLSHTVIIYVLGQ